MLTLQAGLQGGGHRPALVGRCFLSHQEMALLGDAFVQKPAGCNGRQAVCAGYRLSQSPWWMWICLQSSMLHAASLSAQQAAGVGPCGSWQ